MPLTRKFTQHPASVGESYSEHLVTAMSFSLQLFKAAIVCGIHAILPFLFEKTGSDCIRCLHDRMVTNRSRLDDSEPADRAEATAR